VRYTIICVVLVAGLHIMFTRLIGDVHTDTVYDNIPIAVACTSAVNLSWYKTGDQTLHKHLTRLTIKRRHVQQHRSDHLTALLQRYTRLLKKKKDTRYNNTDAYDIIMCLCYVGLVCAWRRWNQVFRTYLCMYVW